MFRPEVSVLIASYNHGKYIEKTIESVLQQTFTDFEIVLTDDGSQDDTMERLAKIKDRRLRVFRFHENRGASEAYNHCLSKARGKYLANLSSDDLWLPEKLSLQVQFLRENPKVESVFSTAEIIDESNQVIRDNQEPYVRIFQQKNRTREEWLRFFFENGNCLCHPSVLTRRGLYEKTQVSETRFRQLPDFNLWVRICMDREIHILQNPLVQFRIFQNSSNASGINLNNQIRLENEMRVVFKHYLKMKDMETVEKVFPQSMRWEKYHRVKDVYFQILLAFIQGPTHSHRTFGIDHLYQYFESAKIRKKIRTFDFLPNHLYELSALADSGNRRDLSFLQNEINALKARDLPGL